MWDTVLVILIVVACAVLVGRRIYEQFKGRAACGCAGSCSAREEIKPGTKGKNGSGCDKGSCPF